jgi:hypothetical protein
MAVISAIVQQISANSLYIKYEGLGNDDSGEVVGATSSLDNLRLTKNTAIYPDKTVIISGTWGSATAVVEGSVDGENWITLNDIEGNPLSFTEDSKFKVILENPLFIRVSTSGGTGTDLDAVIIASN